MQVTYSKPISYSHRTAPNRGWASLQSAGFAETKNEVDDKFVNLIRKVAVDEREKPQKGRIETRQMADGEGDGQEWEMIAVAKAEVAGLEAQAWEV